MRKDKPFLELAMRLWPNRHRRFEEMSTLAVTGQLGGAQMCELDEHVAGCNSCREFLESVAQVSLQAMPLLAEIHGSAPETLPPGGMRERFLARLTSETMGAENGAALRPFSVPRINTQPVLPEGIKICAIEQQPPARALTVLVHRLWRPFAFGLACVVVAIAGYYAGLHKTVQSPPQLAQSHPVVLTVPRSPEITPKGIDPDRMSELERQKSELEAKVVSMKEELATAENERESLGKELAAAKERLATLTNRPDVGSTPGATVRDELASERVATLQSQVDRLGQRLEQAEVSLTVQKQVSEELTVRLSSTSADLQRERDLKSAKSELGDVVSARNLHIVDVYDADPSGKRQRSFGRVFYIEGKSLVFYAYDLEDPGRFKANVVFHVWGGKSGTKEVTHSLGILHKDDASQNRWAMTFDDRNVLGQINSVFVTAESATKHYDEPHGKKVLYAYFGGPANHP
jgi:hypothetical protein